MANIWNSERLGAAALHVVCQCVAVMAIATAAAGTEVLRLTGDFGYAPQVVKNLPHGSEVDLRSAVFRVANSRSRNPTAEANCDSGTLPVNPYPLQVRASANVTLTGGKFAGEVPLASDWESTYCNSAGIALRDSPGAVVEGLRMRHVWDAFRVSENTEGFVLRRSWISDVRDDCIENDYLNGGTIEDVLLDGCFSGLSTRPPKGETRSTGGAPVVLRGVLMRMQSYIYKGQSEQGLPFKADAEGPGIEIYDSVVALDGPNIVSTSRLSIGWTQIGNCRGNVLLWMADTPWPKDFERPPACFRIIEGAQARLFWQEARRNWIDCHPDVRRFAGDDESNTSSCDPTAYRSSLP